MLTTAVNTAVEKIATGLEGAAVNIEMIVAPSYAMETHQVIIIQKGAILKAKVDIRFVEKTPLVVRDITIIGMTREKGTDIILDVVAERFAAYI